MRFIVDTQLPRALAKALRDLRHDADHVLDLGIAQGSDRLIAAQARSREAVVITKDEDFVALSGNGLRVLWIRLGNCPNDVLINAISRALPDVLARFEQNEFLVELS